MTLAHNFSKRRPILNNITQTRNHPEMVGDMSHVTLNFDLSKIPFVRFLPWSRPILTPKIIHVHLLVLIWGVVTDADDDDDNNAGHHSTTTRATYCQLVEA